VLVRLLAKEPHTKQGESGALVVKRHMSNPRYRLRLLPAAPLVACRRYLIVVPRPLYLFWANYQLYLCSGKVTLAAM
jgi:hypothetical protein